MTQEDVVRVLINASKLQLPARAKTIANYYEAEYRGDPQTHSRPLDIKSSTHATCRYRGGDTNVVMFGSNNYLGLAQDERVKSAAIEAIREFGVSATGSPTLNGYSPKYAELEERLAAFKGAESCALFSSGFMANIGWAPVLIRGKDAIAIDQYAHTSVIEALKLCKPQSVARFHHNDYVSLSESIDKIDDRPGGDRYIFVEGLYSMHGDIVDLAKVRAIANRKGAITVVDDAHGTGVLGQHGHGIYEQYGLDMNGDIVIGTLSKGLGCVGGFIAGSRDVVSMLRAIAPPYVFSASLPPPIVAGALESLRILERDNDLILRLRYNTLRTRHLLRDWVDDVNSISPIISLGLPPHIRAKEATAIAQNAGVFLNGVGYPAVPVDQEILRISISANHSEQDMQRLLDAVEQVMKRQECVQYDG